MRENKEQQICQVAKAVHGEKKKVAIERTTQLAPKKQFGWLYSFAITYTHSNSSGNLQGNHGIAFVRVFKTNTSFIYFKAGHQALKFHL